MGKLLNNMLEKRFEPEKVEKRIYEMWENGGYFKAERDPKKKPYTIILPPPNASGKMHTGNVLMIAIEDLLIRWKRMQGYSALWIPGTDHAGFETQTTFERELKKEGKTRFSYDRNTLYKLIWEFVYKNKSLIEDQIRQMGASVDWSRYKFTLDADSIDTVVNTFKKMEQEGLVYRSDYLVNYSFKWGTTFSDAETVYTERVDPLYYLKYGPFTLATVRPETKFGDTAVAVHPDDKRYQKYIGQEIEVEGLNGNFKLKVIADPVVDPEFGTGVVKITPAHDKTDFETGKRHNLEIRSVINLDGTLNEHAGKYAGMKIFEARKVIVEDLNKAGLIEKIDENYTHVVPVDYRSGDYIENLVLPNWFIKVDELKKPALDAVKTGKLSIYPKWREITYTQWVENMHDWAISRQIVWGIRIPAWYNIDENPNLHITFVDKRGNPQKGLIKDLINTYEFDEIASGLQTLSASKDAKYVVSKDSPGDKFLQETDTFDTWFSSGQWPLITLGYPDSEDFKYFYPTAVLETGWEIVTRWVSRMAMFGCYLTKNVPFKDVYLHGHIRAIDGKKMSKSLGNVVNPDDYATEFGVDALRMGLISGTANGKDFNFPRDKIIAYRNFGNKIWNMARFMLMMWERYEEESKTKIEFYNTETMENKLTSEDHKMLDKLNTLITDVNTDLEKYRFADAGDSIYHFMWDDLASNYIEHIKTREDKDVALSVFHHIYANCLKLLHPFMPFITEEIWNNIPKNETEPLIITSWPKTH